MEKSSEVKSIQPNGTYDFGGRTFYKFEIQMANGDVGEYSSVSENQTNFMVGKLTEYVFDQSRPQYPKIKPVYAFKSSPNRDANHKNIQKAAQGDNIQKMIVKQSCLKSAIETLGSKDHKHVLKLAEIYVDWVMEDKMPKQSMKETTDLPF